MIKKRRTPYETALLLILNALSYSKAKERKISRFRAGTTVLRRISRRTALREAFLDAVREELNDLGWSMANLPGGENYVFFRADSVERWAGLGAKRLKEEGYLEMSEQDLEVAYLELNGDEEDLAAEGEE